VRQVLGWIIKACMGFVCLCMFVLACMFASMETDQRFCLHGYSFNANRLD